ncbi:MAG: hypothetical protein RLZZ401_834 [Pseudomonadota bacterium]|jgi:HemY protein
MRAALWFLALFGIAVALALFAGNNQSTVTVFWPPHRVDVSLNLVLLTLLLAMLVLHFALRALAALLDLPRQARYWRAQQKERAMHAALLDSLSHLIAGRFLRARKSAQSALQQQQSLSFTAELPPHAQHLSALAHLLVAESAQALQDRTARDVHLRLALDTRTHAGVSQETHEGALLRAARWALEDREPATALKLLTELPQGVARRTMALRLKLKAARQSGQSQQALETARLLAKHRAFSPLAAQSMVRSLATDLINQAHDDEQLQSTWNQLDPAEREMPELAVLAAQRLLHLKGGAAIARSWLLPVWERMAAQPQQFVQTHGDALRVRMVRALEASLDSLDAPWLARLETLQLNYPRVADLQYLVAMACMQRQLWGKAQQLMAQAVLGLGDPALLRSGWRVLAQLAEQRSDDKAALAAWQRAARD